VVFRDIPEMIKGAFPEVMCFYPTLLRVLSVGMAMTTMALRVREFE
jgi:hypothetical protein